MKKYARILYDTQIPLYHYQARSADPEWKGLNSPPQTCPLWKGPKGGKDDIPIQKTTWLDYLREINSLAAFKFIQWEPAGWYNKNKSADTLAFAGNIVEVIGIKGTAAQVKTFQFNNAPKNPKQFAKEFNHETHPELVHFFTVITRSGFVIKPSFGLQTYIFLIGRTPLYIPLSRLVFI